MCEEIRFRICSVLNMFMGLCMTINVIADASVIIRIHLCTFRLEKGLGALGRHYGDRRACSTSGHLKTGQEFSDEAA